MRDVTAWKSHLREALLAARRERSEPAVSVLREVLAAIDNAEAPALATVSGEATEIDRLVLTPAQVTAIVDRELTARREAATQYRGLGREREAEGLDAQVRVLEGLA